MNADETATPAREAEPRAVSRPGVDRVRRLLGPAAWVVVLMVIIAAGLLIERRAILSILTTMFMFVALAQAWNILGGYGGYLNLGMAAFFGVGTYTVSILNFFFGWSPFVTAPLGGLAAVVLAWMIGVPTLRVRGVYFAIVTLVLGFLMQRLAFNIPVTRGALGIFLPPLPQDPLRIEQTFYMVFLAVAIASVVLVRSIEHSRFGAALVAIREDEDAAVVLGVRTTLTKMNAFAVGAFIAGFVGALFAQRITFIDPDAAFAIHYSIDPLLMAMYGGAGTWQGPLIGAPLVVILGEVLRVTFGGLGVFGRTGVPAEAARLIFGIVLILVALFARQGVMGIIRPKGGTKLKI